MAQLMSTKAPPGSDRRKTVAVKREAEDSADDPRVTLPKRSKQTFYLSQQQANLETGDFPIPPSQYNPLDEPSPLGLRLRKSPSLLDLIQMTLSQSNSQKGGTQIKKEHKSSNASAVGDKLKASNFPCSLLRIGTWEYKSKYEGDLVAKCYFAKHKLVWEVLDGGLKNKIEIQWSDIMALKANYPDDVPGTLDVVLSRPPLFFRETNPQPRKHTLWQATSDFTGGQASIQRRHFLQCPQGLMGKHFEKLIQCDPRLNFLSQQGEIEIDSPYFSETNNGLDLNEQNRHAIFDLHRGSSPSGSQNSPLRSDQDFVSRPREQFPRHSSSPSSVIETHRVEEVKANSNRTQELKSLLEKDNLKIPGLHPSMSMIDLVSHIENRISEQKTSNNFPLSSEGKQSLEILDEIKNCLFSESQLSLATDDKFLMSRVDSLCCLLQKDPTQNMNKSDSTFDLFENYRIGEIESNVATSAGEHKVGQSYDGPEGGPSDVFGFRHASAFSRNDSVGDLLLNLPRIASLPQFLFDISEDSDSEVR